MSLTSKPPFAEAVMDPSLRWGDDVLSASKFI